MFDYKKHLIPLNSTAQEALILFNKLSPDIILFIINNKSELLGSLTDGDIRRGLLNGLSLTDKVESFMERKPKYIDKNNFLVNDLMRFRENNLNLIPVLNTKKQIVRIINFRLEDSYLPVDMVIMAGGLGSRLKSLTRKIPKPLLKVGSKAIIEHNIDRFHKYGIKNFHLCVRHFGDQIKTYLTEKYHSKLMINYVWEDDPLGTIGAITKIEKFDHKYILLSNSDILTNMNYENFFLDFISKNADMSVVTIPYSVHVPYAVMETSNDHVISFNEKPTYTYYSNGGIYLIKKTLLSKIPKNTHYNTTDLMQRLIKDGGKLISYPIKEYWLDIGSPQDYKKAQSDIKNLEF